MLDVFAFDDSDGSACDAIRRVKAVYPEAKVIFVNGGDRTIENIPEMTAFSGDPRVEFKFGVGGDYKKNSSSWILRDWATQYEQRKWGKSLTYYSGQTSKVKRLILDPGQSISMQHHNQRSEFWFVEEGRGELMTLWDGREVCSVELGKFDSCVIPVGKWHRLQNAGETPLVVIEIQYGERCSEDDIVRLTDCS